MTTQFYKSLPGSQEFIEDGIILKRTSEAIESADMVVYYLSGKASCMFFVSV